MPDCERTVGTEAMSDQARPRKIEARLAEEGRRNKQQVQRMPMVEDLWVRRLAWWSAKLRAIARGEHVRVLEGVPEEDASAIDGEGSMVAGFDGARTPITSAAMQEATISIRARQKCEELEDWARRLCDGGL